MGGRVAPFDRDELVERFAGYDRSHNQGKGSSDEPDSGGLGWGESGFLDAYVKLYESTGDSGWLDRTVDHFDRMIAARQDHFADGYATWVTPVYSVALLRTGSMHNRGTARIAPEEERVWVIRGGDMAGDSIRVVEILPGRRYAVQEYGTRKVLAGGRFRPGATLNGFAPFKISIVGTARAGDRFWVQVFAGEPLEYIVHQGMFLHPVSRFIEHAFQDAELKVKFGDKARTYLRFIGRQIADKHERDWVDSSPTSGGYRFSPWMTERFRTGSCRTISISRWPGRISRCRAYRGRGCSRIGLSAWRRISKGACGKPVGRIPGTIGTGSRPACTGTAPLKIPVTAGSISDLQLTPAGAAWYSTTPI